VPERRAPLAVALAPHVEGSDTSGMTLPEPDQHLSLAVEAVLKRFGTMVRQVGRQYRLDDSDLDEVLQEVRIRLWRAQRTSEQIGEVSTSYVYRTASSAALDVIRRRRSRRAEHHQSLDDDGAAVALAEPAPDPHGALEGAEVAEQVARALDTIPASRRPVVKMYLTGHPREEIAELMGWTEGKTRNLLYRGLADLRERLEEMGVRWQRAGEAS
jgi:RNA polymerase sigma factor (sigma-70 family)